MVSNAKGRNFQDASVWSIVSSNPSTGQCSNSSSHLNNLLPPGSFFHGPNFALRAHCGGTASTCIKYHPKEKEGGQACGCSNTT